MEAIFNAQVAMAFGIIAVLGVIYVFVVGWIKRLGGDPAKGPSPQIGGDPKGAGGETAPQTAARQTASASESGRKKKQFLIQGKDAEVAANVLRRMLSDHDKT